MSVSAEIRPAQLPLPGGRPDATVRLHPLLAGEVRVPPGLLERPEGRFATLRGLGVGRSRRDWVWLPVPAFLVEHPAAGPILIDAPGGGKLVVLAPAPDAGPHAGAARAALENLARTLSIEWARHAIRTTTIAPGPRTRADDVAALVVYLGSPAGDYFSGCVFSLDAVGPEGRAR